MPLTNIKYAMSIMAVGAFYIFAITFIPPSWRSAEGTEFAKTVLGFILGSLFTIFTQYYWGASKKYPSDVVVDATAKAEAARIDEAAKLEAKNVEDAKIAEAKAKVEADKVEADRLAKDEEAAQKVIDDAQSKVPVTKPVIEPAKSLYVPPATGPTSLMKGVANAAIPKHP